MITTFSHVTSYGLVHSTKLALQLAAGFSETLVDVY
jgi:hypothetical protein